MAASALGMCGTWSVETPRIPVRSRLYSLPPVGVGTRETESLTSYMARLAGAHALELGTLMRWEVFRLVEPRRSVRRWALNGSGLMARKAVAALEHLTARCDLRYLTFTPWARYLNVTPLLRREKAWCPRCYQEQKRLGSVFYEHLLWAVRFVERCHVHNVPLVSECPFEDCRASSSPLATRSRPGHCSLCGRWVGRDKADDAASDVADDAGVVVAQLVEHAGDGPERVVTAWSRPATGWAAWQLLAGQLRS
jgi:hypothetical protein